MPTPSASKHRSPQYPGIGLEAALGRARTFYHHERRNWANFAVALKHWDLNPKSSTSGITVAALVAYGLLEDSGGGSSRVLKLSESALRILLDDREVSPEREQLYKEAALKPTMHRKLWERWGADLPSDANLRHSLIFEWKFNENAVDSFIRQFRATIRFAKLTVADKISEDSTGEDVQPVNLSPIRIGDFVQWESQGVPQFEVPRRVREVHDDGKWAFVDGSNDAVPTIELIVEPKSDAPVPPAPVPRPRVVVPEGDIPPTSPVLADVFSWAGGQVKVQWPATMTADIYEDIVAWLKIIERKIGRSVSQ